MYKLKDKIRTIENRNVSFDLLRICAAFMVVLLHVAGSRWQLAFLRRNLVRATIQDTKGRGRNGC